MFLGQFEHSIDEKGRLTVPSRYRELLVGGAYLTLGFDQNLMVLTAASFENISNRIRGTSVTDEDARTLKRWIFSNATWVEVDKAGRILIPQWLRSKCKLDSTVVVVGAGDFFEIWSPELWASHQEKLLDPKTTAQRFASFDIPL
jgi:MraZ protein